MSTRPDRSLGSNRFLVDGARRGLYRRPAPPQPRATLNGLRLAGWFLVVAVAAVAGHLAGVL